MTGWVYQGQTQVLPGNSVNMGNFIVINQIALLQFPDFPVGARRYFGIGAWRVSATTPQGTIVSEQGQTSCWHNGTLIQFANGAVGGNLQFYCQEKFGSLLTVRAWLLQP